MWKIIEQGDYVHMVNQPIQGPQQQGEPPQPPNQVTIPRTLQTNDQKLKVK